MLVSRYVSTAFRERMTSSIAKVIRAAHWQVPNKCSNSVERLVPCHTRMGNGLGGSTPLKEV